MSKKNKLEGDYPIDFELIGVVSPMKEYKLGWHLNQLDLFHLVKGADIKIEFAGNKLISISNLIDETEFSSVHLLRNKLQQTSAKVQFLVSDLQQFDYLLKLKNSLIDSWSKEVMTKLKDCEAVDYAVVIDLDKVKARENLIF
ncbi:IPExxxVDY family protein [Marinoscillum sp. MHG1-6]|uniref:IPExxxVDY family protein n=1 Tax=Marinoscillum sp. MHG1-6 TaxID=2959627 RepID=UPI0021587070|nr:IPExxxVDY family protein [Marinoscillum sp. MHG1-6]